MTTTPLTLTPAATGPAPMPAEQAEAHISRLEHLLAELEQASISLVTASWGAGNAPETARYLPDGTRSMLASWAQRITDSLGNLSEQRDCE